MSKQQHYPPTCPTCGAALPHDNPMSREYHVRIAKDRIAQLLHTWKTQRELTLVEYNEALYLCEEVEFDTLWRDFKAGKEWIIAQALQEKKEQVQ